MNKDLSVDERFLRVVSRSTWHNIQQQSKKATKMPLSMGG